MSHLILVRHGQSEWNLEKKFTGWVDVELAPNGKLEACKSGELIKEKQVKIDYFFTSCQKRAIDTLKLILNTLRIKENEIVDEKTILIGKVINDMNETLSDDSVKPKKGQLGYVDKSFMTETENGMRISKLELGMIEYL